MRRIILFILALGPFCAAAQTLISGRVFDRDTKEPLIGANVVVPGTTVGAVTDVNGSFAFSVPSRTDTVEVSYIGYDRTRRAVSDTQLSVSMSPAVNNLQQVIVTASREASLRTESAMAISKLGATEIQDTKPVLITELVNKIPGAVMLNYNNEQHGMAIRQPMGTSAYFLYMEDGIPLRPMGIFNHNALIEMNVFNISSVEVVKGPASSLYGPEAVGGALNFITHLPTAVTTARLGIQGDQWGYKRVQYAAGGTIGKKVGIFLSGFEARQRDGWQAFSDYDKSSVNARVDFSPDKRTRVVLAFSGNEYFSDMTGSVDSIAFYSRQYSSTTDFTYRKVHAQRTRLSVTRNWNASHETMLTLAYRDNYIEQNPNYAIRWTQGSETASGEVNRNTFYSKVAMLQHITRLHFLDARLVAGASVDLSPTNYWAYKLDLGAKMRADGRSVERYTLEASHPDQFLSRYTANLRNMASYAQIEFAPIAHLRVTAGVRYDNMSFDYVNLLANAEGGKTFRQLTPKVGMTYDLQRDKGLYVNYSQGFAPPGLTAIFRKRPSQDPNAPAQFYYNLEPARFDNVELGGWAGFLQNTLYVDVTLYHMTGRKELLSVRQPDNSTDYQSAGKTLHRGVEYGVTYRPRPSWHVRFGGTNAVHRFEEFTLSNRASDAVANVNGNDMPQAPRWIANAEVTYKPVFLKGFRVAMEWQRIGRWYQDQVNNVRYEDRGLMGMRGVSYLNLRAGYAWKSFEVFTNVLNLTDELYANSAVRGNSRTDRTAFTAAAPRTFVFGVQYNFAGKN